MIGNSADTAEREKAHHESPSSSSCICAPKQSEGEHQKQLEADKWCSNVQCYTSRQTYVEVNDTYSEGGTHKKMLRPQSKARVMNKRQGD